MGVAGTTWKERVWRATNLVMLVAFLFSAIVQINDPDPLLWVLVYGLAAVACLLEFTRHAHWTLPALVALAAAVWAGTIAPRVVGRVPFLDMFGAFEMESLAVEESREMYGLLVVAIWMAALAWRVVTRARRNPGS